MKNKKSFAYIFFYFLLVSSLSIIVLGQIDVDKVKAQQQQQKQQQVIPPGASGKNPCIKFDSTKKQIFISCPSGEATSLTDIYNQLNNPNILNKQSSQQPGVWLLNANLVVDKGSTLTIDNKDTTWLKILTDEKTPTYGIFVHGGLKIDNVKVTSWNPITNYYALSNGSRESSASSTAVCGSECSNALKSN